MLSNESVLTLRPADYVQLRSITVALCQATRQTDPLTTRGIDPPSWKEVEVQEMDEQAPRSEWIEGRQAMQTPEDV